MTRRNGFLTDASDTNHDVIEFAEMFPKIPAVVIHRTRCGKPHCRCNYGELHGPVVYLRWREGDRQRRRYVRQADVAAVYTIITRRRRLRALERARLAADLAHLRRLEALRREFEAPVDAEGRNA